MSNKLFQKARLVTVLVNHIQSHRASLLHQYVASLKDSKRHQRLFCTIQDLSKFEYGLLDRIDHFSFDDDDNFGYYEVQLKQYIDYIVNEPSNIQD